MPIRELLKTQNISCSYAPGTTYLNMSQQLQNLQNENNKTTVFMFHLRYLIDGLSFHKINTSCKKYFFFVNLSHHFQQALNRIYTIKHPKEPLGKIFIIKKNIFDKIPDNNYINVNHLNILYENTTKWDFKKHRILPKYIKNQILTLLITLKEILPLQLLFILFNKTMP